MEKLYTVSKTRLVADSGSEMNSLLQTQTYIEESRENK